MKNRMVSTGEALGEVQSKAWAIKQAYVGKVCTMYLDRNRLARTSRVVNAPNFTSSKNCKALLVHGQFLFQQLHALSRELSHSCVAGHGILQWIKATQPPGPLQLLLRLH